MPSERGEQRRARRRSAIAIVLGAWLKRWSAWLAILAVAVDTFLQASSGGARPGVSQLNAWLLHAYVCGAVGVTWGLHLHSHLLRPGIGVVPGMRSFHVRVSLMAVAVLLGVPIVAALLVGGHPLVLLVTTPLPLALGLFVGSASSPNSKAYLAGIAGLVLGSLQIPQWAVENSRSGQVPPLLVTLQQHGTLVSVGCVLLGIVMLAFVLRGVAGAVESGWWFRNRTTRGVGDRSCGFDESMRGMWILRVLPAWAERRIVALRTPEPLGPRALSMQWQRTAGPMSPWGQALVGAPVAVTITTIVGRDDPESLILFLMVFMTNMLVGVGLYYSKARLRLEWLRPATRDQLVEGFAWAMTRDYAVYVIVTWLAMGAAFAVFVPKLFDSVAGIGPLLVAPSVAALGFSVTMSALRIGRYGGTLGFFLSALPCGLLCIALAESPRGASLGAWLLLALAIALVAAALLPLARHLWMRAELGGA